PPACGVTGTETAQRFLASAYDSVEAELMTRETLRGIRRTQGGDVRGRLTSPEEDQLRAAIVLTGAGLDATLKQLIRDTLVHLVIQNEQGSQPAPACSDSVSARPSRG